MDPPSDLSQNRFDALFQAHSRAILGYTLRRVVDPADAADVVSETFLVAWRRVAEIPREQERLWLYGVARRVLANARRGDARRSRLGERLREDLAGCSWTQPVEDPRAETVRAALSTLADDDQEVLRLAFWEDLTPAEIAVVLSIPGVTARTRLHRARQRLRGALAEPDPAVPAPTAPRLIEETP